jgi:hypothetical protein
LVGHVPDEAKEGDTGENGDEDLDRMDILHALIDNLLDVREQRRQVTSEDGLRQAADHAANDEWLEVDSGCTKQVVLSHLG